MGEDPFNISEFAAKIFEEKVISLLHREICFDRAKVNEQCVFIESLNMIERETHAVGEGRRRDDREDRRRHHEEFRSRMPFSVKRSAKNNDENECRLHEIGREEP